MNEADKIHRAERAKQLLADDILAEAITAIAEDAAKVLATVSIDDADTFYRAQATIAVARGIVSHLQAAIIATGESDGGFSLDSSKGE